jgi:hypothetical protein
VVLVPVVVPVVPVPVVPVELVVCCPHAGNANTNSRVRAASGTRKYILDFSPLDDTCIAGFTLLHWRKSRNFASAVP